MMLLYIVRQHPSILCLGISLGMLSTLLVTTWSTTNSSNYSHEQKCRQSGDLIHQSLHDETTIHKTVYIGVLTSKYQLKFLAEAIHNSWGQTATSIEYYITGSIKVIQSNLPVVNATFDDELTDMFLALLHMYNKYIHQFNWFLIANDKMYVRVSRLKKLLNKLDPTADVYIGATSQRPEDSKFKSYRQALYCKGDTGIVLSRNLLQKLAPYLKTCSREASNSESADVILGYCIKKYIGVQCSSSKEVNVKVTLYKF